MKSRKHFRTVQTLSHQQIFIDLLRWMKLNGYKNSKNICPANFPDTGRGMMAKREILENTCLISIPRNLLITTSVVLESWLGDFIRSWTSKLTPMEIITIFLVYEKRKQNDSFWISYLNSLPTKYNLSPYWKKIPEDIPHRFKDSFLNQIRIIRTSYNNLKPFFEYVEDRVKNLHGAMNFDEFLWGWSTIQTRSVHFKQKITDDPTDNFALAPFLDLFNHSPSAKVTAGFNNKSQNYEIVTHQKCAKCSQIFINYGEHDNCKLILNYGFYVLHNPNSSVEFTLSDICSNLKLIHLDNDRESNFKTKINMIREKCLFRDVYCTFNEISWSLLVCARILVSNFKELQSWNRALEGPFSITNESLANNLIQTILKTRINCVEHAINTHVNLKNETWFALLNEEFDILNSCKTKLAPK